MILVCMTCSQLRPVAAPVVIHTVLVHTYRAPSGFDIWKLSPDGRYIAFDNVIYSTSGFRKVATLPVSCDYLQSIAWSNHARRIIYCHGSYLYLFTFLRPGWHWKLFKLKSRWNHGWTHACFMQDGAGFVGLIAGVRPPNDADRTRNYDEVVVCKVADAAVKSMIPMQVVRNRFGGLCGDHDAVLMPYKRNSVVSIPDEVIIHADGAVERCPKSLNFSGTIFDLNTGVMDQKWFIHASQFTESTGADLIQEWQYTKLFLESLDGRHVLPLGWNKSSFISQFAVSTTGTLWAELEDASGSGQKHVVLREYKIVGLKCLSQRAQ